MKTAQEYVTDGHFFWNAGIFVWNIDTIMAEFRKYTDKLCEQMDEMAAYFDTQQETEVVNRIFPMCEKSV